MADYTFANFIPGFAHQEHEGWHHLGPIDLYSPVINANGHVTLSHVVFGVVSAVLIVILAMVARRKYSSRETALIPEPRFSIRNFFEMVFDAVYNMMRDMMGEKQALRFFPLIASLAIFILVSNLMGLVPGLIPPTQNLNTNIGPAIIVFFVYHAAGLFENGFGHVKHMMGPVLLLAPLIFVIEIIGHIARPISLGVRLTGNMTGDHMVLGVFASLADGIMGVPFLLPIPFLFLGLLVSVIQTLVFCLLSSVYIALSVAHEEH